jgi:hypothetical protein
MILKFAMIALPGQQTVAQESREWIWATGSTNEKWILDHMSHAGIYLKPQVP